MYSSLSKSFGLKLFFALLIGVTTIGCDVKEKNYDRVDEAKPELAIDQAIGNNSVEISPSTHELNEQLASGDADPYEVFEQLKSQVLLSEDTVNPQTRNNADLVQQLEILNNAVLAMIESNHPRLQEVLDVYEVSIFNSCAIRETMHRCDRHPYFSTDSRTSTIALAIARRHRASDWNRYFLLVEFSFAIKGVVESPDLLRIYAEDFPYYQASIDAGETTAPEAELLQRRRSQFREALCNLDSAEINLREESVSQIRSQFFSFQRANNNSQELRQNDECFINSLGDRLIDESVGPALRASLAAHIEASTAPVPSPETSYFDFGSTYKGIEAENLNIATVLHTPGIDLDTLDGDNDMVLLFLVHRIFQMNIGGETVEAFIAQAKTRFDSDEAFHLKLKEITKAYVTTYLVYTAKYSHKVIGSFFGDNNESGMAFISRIFGQRPSLRQPWKEIQNRTDHLTKALDTSIWAQYRQDGQDPPAAAVELEAFLYDLPINVKYIADIPANLMLGVYMAQNNWSVPTIFGVIDASTILEEMIDGRGQSFFDFTYQQTIIEEEAEADSVVAIEEHEVKFGFDFLFRLRIFEDYGVSLEEAFELIVSQYMTNVIRERPGSTFKFMDDYVEPLRRLYNSQATQDVIGICDTLSSGQRVPLQIVPHQFAFSAAMGNANSRDSRGRREIMHHMRLLYTDSSEGAWGGPLPGFNYGVKAQFETAELLRTTVIPRFEKLRQFLELLKETTKDQSWNISQTVDRIETNYFSVYKNLIIEVYDIYENFYPRYFDCLLDLTELEEQRRDFLMRGELEYYKSLYKGIQFFRSLSDTERQMGISNLRSRFEASEVWSLPIFQNVLNESGSNQMTWLEAMQATMNRPHWDSYTRLSFLEGVFAEKDSITVGDDGSVFLTLIPQRFAYRARTYYEEGVKYIDGRVEQTNDIFDEEYLRFPESYSDIRDSIDLRRLFNESGRRITVPSTESQFMSQVFTSNERHIYKHWYGSAHTRKFSTLFSGTRLKVSIARSRAKVEEYRGNDCDEASDPRACRNDLVRPILADMVEDWSHIYRLVEQSDTRKEVARLIGAESVYNIDNPSMQGFEFWAILGNQYFMDTELNPLPVFDYPIALVAAPFLGYTATQIPRRIVDGGASPWELKLHELALAQNFFDSAHLAKNNFGLDAEGNIRANQLLLEELSATVQHRYDINDMTVELVRSLSAEDFPNVQFMRSRPTVFPGLYDPRMLSDMRLLKREFHCDTYFMFTEERFACE